MGIKICGSNITIIIHKSRVIQNYCREWMVSVLYESDRVNEISPIVFQCTYSGLT